MIPQAELYHSPMKADCDSTEFAPALSIANILPFPESERPSKPLSLARKSRYNIAFQSKKMNALVQLATRFAKSSAAVMITGESGTGKELFSRLIHEKSDRPQDAFHAINCAAIPEPLMESEIFGHERGAFTGASQKRQGHFQLASGGTLLLDEISEIPLNLQAKLLRVIEEQEVQTIGGNRAQQIDVRIVVTSNRNLKREVAAGRFRADLYHRLNVLELPIPSLKERVTDIPLLVLHFVEMYRTESQSGIERVTKEAMQLLCEYDWPGNVRELRNVIHRACIVATTPEISPACLPELMPSDSSSIQSLSGLTLADVEQKLILSCLQKFGGNKRSAAMELGVTSRTLSNKLKHYREQGMEIDY